MSTRGNGLALRLLGGFSLTMGGCDLALAPRAERLIAFLALRDGVPRDLVAFRLWAEHTEEQAGACLRSTLWRLPKPDGRALIRADSGQLRLSGQVDTDVRRVRRMLEGWQPDQEPPTGVDSGTLSTDLLPSWYDDWLIIERERHHQLRLHSLERLSRWHLSRATFADAIEAGLQAVAGDPLRESAHRCLVQAHLCEGNLSEALRQTRTYLDLLREAGLPVRLSAQMEALTGASDAWHHAPSSDSHARQ
jgi:DNA-binding SARP family transcriptional activator